MRGIPRSFLTAVLLTLAAGFALSQEAGAPLPPLAPDVAAPVVELPKLPVVVAPVPGADAPAVDPAVTIDPSVLAVAPAGVETARAPEPVKPVVATVPGRVAIKSPAKPIAKPSVEATGSFQPVTVESLNPPGAPANTASARGQAVAATAVNSVIPESAAASGSRTMIIGEWVLAGLLLVGLYGFVNWLRHRGTRPRSSVIAIPVLDTELKPAPVARM